MEVPEIERVAEVEPIHAERMFTPGAKLRNMLEIESWIRDQQNLHIEDRAEVGERSAVVIDIGSTDSNDRCLRCWGNIGGILVLVASSDDNSHTSRDSVANSSVGGSRVSSSKGHADN